VALVTVSLTAFSYYSFKTYMKWYDNPIILEMDEQLTKIYEIPFPAVSRNLLSCAYHSNSSVFRDAQLFFAKAIAEKSWNFNEKCKIILLNISFIIF
jgi:hypothetical protein